jgi:hypothetical protein
MTLHVVPVGVLILTVTLSRFTQPAAEVAWYQYVVVDAGETVIDGVMAPVLQRCEAAAGVDEPVSVMAAPGQA